MTPDEHSLAAWREFEARFPDRARLIELAWLYEQSFQQIAAAKVRIGPLLVEEIQIEKAPYFPHIVGWAICGGPREEIGHAMFNAAADAVDERSLEPLHVAVGALLIGLAAGGIQPPANLDGLIGAVQREMEGEEGDDDGDDDDA